MHGPGSSWQGQANVLESCCRVEYLFPQRVTVQEQGLEQILTKLKDSKETGRNCGLNH